MGGKAFPNSKPIRKEELTTLYQQLMADVLRIAKDFIWIGSAGSNGALQDEYSDIDIAVLCCENVEWAELKAKLSEKYPNRTISTNLFSILYNSHQIDLMRSKDINFSRWYFGVNNTKYKAIYRNLLLESIIKTISVRYYEPKNYDNIEIRWRNHLDNFNGLVLLTQIKRFGASRFKTIDKFPITFSHWEITQKYDLNNTFSFEEIFRQIINPSYKYYDKKKEIITEYVEMISNCKLEIPEPILAIK